MFKIDSSKFTPNGGRVEIGKGSKLTHPNLHLTVAEWKVKQHNLHLYLVLSSSTTLPKVLMVLYCQTIKTLMGVSGKK